MSPILIAWIVAVVAGSVVGKLLGTFLRKRSLGLVGNPVVAIIGGIATWQGAILAGIIAPTDAVGAGVFSLVGGIILLVIASRFKTPALP